MNSKNHLSSGCSRKPSPYLIKCSMCLDKLKQRWLPHPTSSRKCAFCKLRPVPRIITACRFVAYIQTPARFSNKSKLMAICQTRARRAANQTAKGLAHPRLDSAGVGSLKDVSRKVFEAARRTKKDNSFKRAYEQSLANTKNAVHARLSAQRKILSTLRAMWLSRQPYRAGGT